MDSLSGRRGRGARRLGAILTLGITAWTAGCATTSSGAFETAAIPRVVFQNLGPRTVWVYLDGQHFGQLLGSVPSLSRAELRVPADLLVPGSRVRLTVVNANRGESHAEVVDQVEVPVGELREMEWTLRGRVLAETPLRGVPLAGGRGRP